ncbi:kinesin family member 11 [Cladophialophora psammophila CBS 110553]|uniref:Kinesin family member 11 n=1 Tax=Cladophialophora psammophila CBS 110553 TaxID=1182543 RepID=W9Y0D7_9EURO|nr:kinesin family member 11 [Cladophialophora psammophila CBS 110553]EXJ75949.1 kinesin family member 11 [Cladophialophora psammophila CBS 110553]
MSGSQRPAHSFMRTSMRPPPRPHVAQYPSITGRAPSPAESLSSSSTSNAGTKRKERDFDQDHGEETNIHVVVRCRGRSAREVRENSGVVVSTSGVRGKTVELSMGPNAISNKTYYFDKVFSPAADQAIIFDDVVAPILNEMLTGYNCTIFAYGQTGTGKTYTMSGDMTDTLGLLSDAAGIIPRVLYSLFQKLEADEVECSVKCSFIELYNEELRDLLSPDNSVKLKIFDDASRKSHAATVVQGMEESHIKNAAAGIKLLREGSHRRQVAATKCNDLSSRSHTVFTITTYVKKPNNTGEDYICSGKLNLVDLAGSENIQRSGAENKRAAEAGLINKSLLTLGRVINALVDKSSHIPYRESKLTRLLQDSLGGRTKTCIIATVSPAKSNLEETISTLDYAFRAKNIRNKPQVNSMISKKTLLKEFTAEIEKLKSELIATRQRNGVYLTNDQYEEITVESESRRILSEEQKARIETMEVSLRNKVQELFSLTNSFTMLKRENEGTRATLESTKDVLENTEAVLADTKRLLAEETALREAHEVTEEKLFGMGTELVSTVGVSLKDIDGLQAKLRRRSVLHTQNRRSFNSSLDRVMDVCGMVDERIAKFQAAHAEAIAASARRIESFLADEIARTESSTRLSQEKSSALAEDCAGVEKQSAQARDSMNNVLEEIKDLRENVKDNLSEGLRGLSQAAAKISAEVIGELEQFHTQLHSSYSGLGKDFKSMFDDLTKQLAVQREEIEAMSSALREANGANIEASLSVSTQLEAIRDEERKAAAEQNQNLKEQILKLIEMSHQQQEQRLSSRLNNVQSHLVESTEKFENADKAYRDGMNKWTIQDSELTALVVKSKDELKTRMKGDWTAVSARNLAIQKSTKAVHEETVKIVDAQLTQMSTQMEALDDFVTRARLQNDSHHAERSETLSKAVSRAQDGLSSLEKESQLRRGVFEDFAGEQKTYWAGVDKLVVSLEEETRHPLREMKADLSEASLSEYTPTGETPQKREWNYPTQLPRTENHESIIARIRGLPDPALVTKTPSSAKTPARSPRKQASPRKGPASPSKLPSPSKTKIFTDIEIPSAQPSTISLSQTQGTGSGIPLSEAKSGLKEVDINVINSSRAAISSATSTTLSSNNEKPVLLDFSKSVGSGSQQPPLKRHATTNAVVESRLPTVKSGRMTRSTMAGLAGIGIGGVENFSQSIGPLGGGRRLRSSPPE